MDDDDKKVVTNALALIAMMAMSDLAEERVSLEDKLAAIEGQVRVIRAVMGSEPALGAAG